MDSSADKPLTLSVKQACAGKNLIFFFSGHMTWASENFLDIVPNCLSPLYDSEHKQTQK